MAPEPLLDDAEKVLDRVDGRQIRGREDVADSDNLEQVHCIRARVVRRVVEVQHHFVERRSEPLLQLLEERYQKMHKAVLVSAPVAELEAFEPMLRDSRNAPDGVPGLVLPELQPLAFRSEAVLLTFDASEGGLVDVHEV